MTLSRLTRLVHHWATLAIALPVCVVIGTGCLLILKKELDWVQPPTIRGSTQSLSLGFDEILAAARTVPEAGIASWADVDRLDVRPDKGMVKVRARSRWEVQIDTATAEVLHSAYRRSDLIESLHDGSFFHDQARLWIFLPAGCLLAVMWLSGLYLFALPHLARARKARKRATKAA